MSAILERPTDPTAGMSLVSNRNPDLAKTRYLFFAGNLIDPDRQFQIEHLRYSNGGEEIQTHCLRRSIGGFLERGRLTPMEVWTEALPGVLLGEGLEGETVRIEGPMDAQHVGVNSNRPGALAGVGSSLSLVKFYPGDEINNVLRANDGKGIVEVRALIDVSWYADERETEKGVPQILNDDFFPTRPPVTLSGLREMVERSASRSELHGLVARDMTASCLQFKRWGEARLSAEHNLLRQRVSPNGQFTYQYSPVARLLLEQLEMKPQDTIMEQAAGITAEQLQAIIGSVGGGQQIDPALIGQIAGAVAQQFLAAQQANAQAVPSTSFEAGGGIEAGTTTVVAPKGKSAKARKEENATQGNDGGGAD